MDTIDIFLTETEAQAEHAYRRAYYAEYMRVYDARYSGDRERSVFWAGLAHSAAKLARERVLLSAEAASL